MPRRHDAAVRSVVAAVAGLAMALPRTGDCALRFDRYDVQVTLDSPDIHGYRVASVAHGVLAAGTSTIALDYEGGTVDSVRVSLDGVEAEAATWRLRDGRLEIDLPRAPGTDAPLTVATAVTAPFAGPGSDGLVRHASEDGIVYSTQFQPAAARKVFPLVDRPDAPATFHFTLHCPSACLAFSNAPPRDVAYAGSTTTFHDTPPLSPHLAAFVAGDLARSTEIEAGRRRVSLAVVSPERYQPHAARILSLARRVVEAFEQQGLELPGDKLDLVLVPEFRYYGMENPGILFFRAELVTWAATGHHWPDLEQLIAHEIAHQWFGNLLAPSRWRDIWISESFATWATSRVMPRDEEPLLDLVDQVRGIGLPVVSGYPQVEASPDSIFTSSRYGRGAAILHAVFAPGTPLGVVLEGLLAGDDRVYLTTDELLARLDQSGLSQVEITQLRDTLETVSPRPMVVPPQSHGGGEACLAQQVPQAGMLGIWIHSRPEAYERAFRCLGSLDERARLQLDASVFAAAWSGLIPLRQALALVAAEAGSSRGSPGDAVRARVLGYLLQALPASRRQASRDAVLEQVKQRRGGKLGRALSDMLPTRPPPGTPTVAELESGALAGSKSGAPRESLSQSKADVVRWLVTHPGAWPLSQDDAYRFLRSVILRDDRPLDGVGIEPFDRFLATNVESDRHDNIASAFAGTCDRHSLALLLGTGRFLEAASIEQRDASAQAIRACLFVRQRDAGLAAAAMPGD